MKQLTATDLQHLERQSLEATGAAARALSVLLATSVEVGHTSCVASSLTVATSSMNEMSSDVTVIHVELGGGLQGQLLFVCSSAAARALTLLLVDPLSQPGPERDAARADVISEVGNIVLTSYLNELVALTGIAAEPSPPSVAYGSPAAVLAAPIAHAASDSDVVLQVDSMLLVPRTSAIATRAPFHIIFLPSPGSMSLLLHNVTPRHPIATAMRVEVPMGELAVSRRPNHRIVASSLGSCIAIAFVDRITRVAAVAHVMLPEAPRTAHRHLQRSYPARFADTAVPALLSALEQAGGKRMYAQVYLAGGGQMFRGPLADSLDIPDQNIAAVEAAVRLAGLTITAADVGGYHGRSLEIDMETLAVRVARDGSRPVALDAA